MKVQYIEAGEAYRIARARSLESALRSAMRMVRRSVYAPHIDRPERVAVIVRDIADPTHELRGEVLIRPVRDRRKTKPRPYDHDVCLG